MKLTKNTITGEYEFEDGQSIHFQNGVVPENGVNGVQVDDVLNVLIDRMEYLNELKSDVYNEITINSLKAALYSQETRNKVRESHGVEGTEKD